MSQHSFNVANQLAAAFRADCNNAFQALASNNSGAAEPATKYAYMWWPDTANGVMRQRNAGNTAWIVRGPLAETLMIARAANTVLAAGDFGRIILATGTWTQTFNAASTLGDGWFVEYRNDGTGVITLDPNASELIDGAATIQLAPGETCCLYCDGTQIKTIGRSSPSAQTQAATAFTTAGTAPNFTLTPAPAITAYAANQRFRVKFHVIGAGTDQLNISGLGNKALKQYDSTGAKVNAIVAASQLADVEYDGTDLVIVDPLPPSGGGSKIQPVTALVGSNALTCTLNPTSLDFRSATLGSGSVNSRTIAAAISVVVPSNATLGTANAIQNRLALLAIDNAGTVELAVVNIAGGNNLDETTLISTTAISASATLNNVIYSTTARANVPFRVVGYVESTQATAGTWATAPSTIQGYGGQALAAMSSFGFGQSRQNLNGSRAIGTTYYNAGNKLIYVSVYCSSGSQFGITFESPVGITVSSSIGSTVAYQAAVSGVVLPGESYRLVTMAGSPSISAWMEIK